MFGMVKSLFLEDPSQTDWEVCAGISAGSIVSAFVCQTRPNDPSGFAKKLAEFERRLLSPKFHPLTPWHSNSILNTVSAFLWHGSFYQDGVESLVTQNLGPLHRRLQAGAFNLDTSKYETLTTLRGVMASSAVPVAFPTVEIKGQQYTDGSMAHWFPIVEIEAYVRRPGPKRVDLLMCYPLDREGFLRTGAVPTHRKMVHSMAETVSQRNWLTYEADCARLRALGAEIRPGVQYVKDLDWTLRIISPKLCPYSDFTHMSPSEMQRLIREGMESVERKAEPLSLHIG